MIYLCINLYKSVTKVDNYFVLCKKFLIFFLKICIFLSFSHKFGFLFAILTFRVAVSFVRLTGLEPARRETPDPKSDASTNSATGAFSLFGRAFNPKRLQRYEIFFIPPKVYVQILSSCLFLDRNLRLSVGPRSRGLCRTLSAGAAHRMSDRRRTSPSSRWAANW